MATKNYVELVQYIDELVKATDLPDDVKLRAIGVLIAGARDDEGDFVKASCGCSRLSSATGANCRH